MHAPQPPPECALRALSYLVRLDTPGRARARDIAAATDIPRPFLQKILHLLTKKGTLDVQRNR